MGIFHSNNGKDVISHFRYIIIESSLVFLLFGLTSSQKDEIILTRRRIHVSVT